MLKKYIQDIAKHEARKILLSNYKEKLVYEIKQKKELEEENRRIKSQLSNNIYFNMYQKQVEHTELLVKEKEKEIEELKVLYEAEKDKNYKTLESEVLKQENEKLEESIKNLGGAVSSKNNLLNEKNKEIEQLKEYREIDFKASLRSGFQSEDLKQQNDKLKEEIEKSESETIRLTNLLNEKIDQLQALKQENIHLNKRLDEYSETLLESIKIKDFLQDENETLKKENKILQKSYDFISNNELAELQSKVISKERIATELSLMLSKEKNKNKELEDKFQRIYKTIEENYYQDGYYELLRIKNIISEILKES